MSSEVRHLVDDGRPFPLVRLAGVLDATTAPTVRSVLLDVLAGQPEAVVVDVGGLDVAEPGAVAVLRDVYQDTADWPAAQLTLLDARDASLWRDSGWPVRVDSAGAFAELSAPEQGHRVSLDLEPRVGAARRSRELITESCARWGRAALAGSACIVVTEMVNNVVAHARTPMVVLLAVHGDGMSVAVRDQSETVPAYTGVPVAPTAYGGRGMLLIDSVASRWGSLVLARGKVVWALLSPDSEGPDGVQDTTVGNA
ncbi:ATP-binding protein [Paractinoplanes rishiriensis]|uniref:Sulfate transporter n=1 Tax=Paractinoplanes rishiriensis TaxID=1050105 RepID=A0A919JVE6_9ACTN|nr:ATP-binding protein [Actinoplanes rishiriensis]GIE94032.1 sulfate transporter [Actinoplanes rishiriensis]